MHQYIYNQLLKDVNFEAEEIFELLGKENRDEVTTEDCIEFNSALSDILSGNLTIPFIENRRLNISEADIEKIKLQLKRKTQEIRNNILHKYLQSENLHFLISNGCSLYSGSKAINNEEKSEHSQLLESFKMETEFENKEQIESVIQNLAHKRPEEALDKLYQILSYYQNVIMNQIGTEAVEEIENFIYKFKQTFIKNFVLTVNYDKNHLHKAFFKKIVSRNSKLKKANIFTLNYDLLVEKTAEELGVYVNNGFAGFHYRTFMPSTYHLDTHLNYADGDKVHTKGINLFKLHGSLSWVFDDSKPPYGISEIQQDFKKLSAENQSIDTIPECIIYPVQSKKTYSLDLPYSEMFRQFIEFVNKTNSVLMIMGYSFWDEHVNDIITNALSNPDFNLIVFSFQNKGDQNMAPYLKSLINRSEDDSRITIFFGNILGDFEQIVRYLIPYPHHDTTEQIILETLQKLKEGQ